MQSSKWLASLALVCFCIAGLARAADYSGTYSAPNVTLKLQADAGAYTGTLVINNTSYPVAARENADSLDGSFTSLGAKFDFTARLKGDKLTIRTGGKSYELTRQGQQPPPPPNPFEQVHQDQAPQPVHQGQPDQNHEPAPAPAAAPSGDAAIAALKNLSPVQADPKRDWLILVYLDGDNNLEEQGGYNIKQMERGLPDSGVDVIVLYDRPIKKARNGHENHPCVYRVKKDQHPDYLDSQVIKDLGAINMADPNVLAAFIEGAVKAFPARQHALFTWDHGGGWAALTIDENAPGKPDHNDRMDMPRFRAGLVSGMKACGLQKWDIIAFDMCLMAQFEVAAELHDLTDVMVASEAVEPGKGLPYTRVLQAFSKGTLGGRRIAADIVTEYDKFHKEDGVRSTTLSALDMAFFDQANAKLNAVVDKLIPAMPKDWSSLAKSYFYAEGYAASRDDFRHGKAALQSIDLLDALKKCRAATPSFPAEAEYKDLVQTMDRFIIASANSDRRQMSNGLAIYAPCIQEAYDPNYEKLEFAKISHWPRLLQALYPEQAKNNQPPTFGKIQLLDAQKKPVAAVKPLVGISTSIEVDGKNMVWVKHMQGVRDADAGGVRVLVIDYVIDDNYIKKLTEGAEHFSQDIDLLMPQLADGKNTLTQSQLGLSYLVTNGEKSIPAMFDNSSLGDPSSFIVLVQIEHPDLGAKPVRAIMHGEAVNLAAERITLIEPQPDGKVVLRQYDPPADAKITPLFKVYKDDGTQALVGKDSLTWNKGLTFTMDLLPAGDYEDIFEAETMTGAKSTARYRYKAETDEELVKAKDTWKGFNADVMPGTWIWALPGNPLKSVDTTMTLEATRQQMVYKMTLDAPGDDGKRKITGGLLILEIHDQPFYRLILIPAGQGKPTAMLGTMWWKPAADGTPLIGTRSLALDMNIIWVKKAGAGREAVAEKPRQRADGWLVISDANHAVSLAIPPGFKSSDDAIQKARAAMEGYDFGAMDPNLFAGIEIIRFDGVHDQNAALQKLLQGAQKLNVTVQVGQAQQSKISGVDCITYQAQCRNNNVNYVLAINLIPTAKGYVALDFACSPFTIQQAAATLEKIKDSIEVKK